MDTSGNAFSGVGRFCKAAKLPCFERGRRLTESADNGLEPILKLGGATTLVAMLLGTTASGTLAPPCRVGFWDRLLAGTMQLNVVGRAGPARRSAVVGI